MPITVLKRLQMTYCELWLESEGGLSQFRVALLVPDEFDLPEGFTLSDSQPNPEKKFYVSEWLDGIVAAAPVDLSKFSDPSCLAAAMVVQRQVDLDLIRAEAHVFQYGAYLCHSTYFMLLTI